MWIYMNDAFVSIVIDRSNPKNFLVRGRFEGDVQRAMAFASSVTVIETPEADYRFRASMSRAEVVGAIQCALSEIDYLNFKSTVKQPWRHDLYMAAWSAAMREQVRQENHTPPLKGKALRGALLWPESLIVRDALPLRPKRKKKRKPRR